MIQTLTDEQALDLIESHAPISISHTSDRYLFVQMRSQGDSNEEIAEGLSHDLEYIEDLEREIIKEFLR